MKSVFILILISQLLFPAITNAKNISWQKLDLLVPSSWDAKQTPMASLHGYFLETKLKKEIIRFFVHTHRPPTIATKRGSKRYWKDFNSTFDKDAPIKCTKMNLQDSYKCQSIIFSKKSKRWSLKIMYWVSNKERLIINTDDFKSQSDALSMAKKFKVTIN